MPHVSFQSTARTAPLPVRRPPDPRRETRTLLATLALLLLAVCSCVAQADPDPGTHPRPINAGILRFPAVSETQIAFVYAGDIWLAPKDGGIARRLSSPPGQESFPRFSPDGSQLAFSGHYDGNLDIYVMPVTGGVPRRVTHHGARDRMVTWYPDGEHLLFASDMKSPRNRFNQLYKVPATGGLPMRLPVPYGEFGEISPDGTLLAYIPISVDFRTWKRYRGGMNPDIWLFNLETFDATNITDDIAADASPMWHGDKLYFLSDRDENKRANIWVLEEGQARQITHFTEHDVHFPSIGPSDIVFENAGKLHLIDLETEEHREIAVTVVTDQATLKPRVEPVSEMIHAAAVSPTGKRALLQARGDLFSLPAEHGVVRNLTRSSGIAERYPSWSPDGEWIVYFTDRSGEYELARRPAGIPGEEEILTDLGHGFRYRPQWSPDSRKVVFIDETMSLQLHDFETEATTSIDQQLWLYHPSLEQFRVSWSADSRWIAYSKDLPNRQSAIALYDCENGSVHQVTSGAYHDDLPTFDPEGDYLFYQTGREFIPIYSDLDNTWIYANTHRLAAVPLRQDVPSPLAPRNDEEPANEEDEESDDDTEEGEEEEADPGETGDESEDDEDEPDIEPVVVDLEGFEERAVLLPPDDGNYRSLYAVDGKLIYHVSPRTGGKDDRKPVAYYDLEERETQTILADADQIEVTSDGEKLLAQHEKAFAIVDIAADQSLKPKLSVDTLEALVDPRAEWRQLFDDAWRLQRDFFYDPDMHGVDWDGMRERYGALLEDAVTRWDVSYVIGELIAELNASHTYRSGGDVQKPPKRGVGYLGCDFQLTNSAYQIRRILSGAPWDAEARSPLQRPGITNVSEGTYVLAVNGELIDPARDPWAAFQGLDEQPVFLTINDEPTLDGAAEVLVQTLANERRLRYLDWVEANRRYVEEKSDGRIAYVYVPDTGRGGQTELVRQRRWQVDREAMVVDERFNSGGQVPDRFVELLNRPLLNYWGVRHGTDWAWPPVSLDGPMAMLMNGWSGSGGDCFPYYFKRSNLGPLIGMRTWGGLIGITGSPRLVDGGNVTVPAFAMFSLDGEWLIEGHGVDPDIEVVDDPSAMARGEDPQLARAVEVLLEELGPEREERTSKPQYPDRSGR